MTDCQQRKVVVLVEEVHREAGEPVVPPTRKAVAAVVLSNPCAGAYQEDLSGLYDVGERWGGELARRALAALGITGEDVHSFGKAALVGEDGELEHAAALLHPRLGAGVREALGGGRAIVPSWKGRGGLGSLVEVPLGHKDAAYVRSHFDAASVRINDAPRRAEVVLAVALTDSGRPLARVGGLTVDQVQGEDGLR